MSVIGARTIARAVGKSLLNLGLEKVAERVSPEEGLLTRLKGAPAVSANGDLRNSMIENSELLRLGRWLGQQLGSAARGGSVTADELRQLALQGLPKAAEAVRTGLRGHESQVLDALQERAGLRLEAQLEKELFDGSWTGRMRGTELKLVRAGALANGDHGLIGTDLGKGFVLNDLLVDGDVQLAEIVRQVAKPGRPERAELRYDTTSSSAAGTPEDLHLLYSATTAEDASLRLEVNGSSAHPAARLRVADGANHGDISFEFDQVGHLARIHGVVPADGVGAWNETLGLGRALPMGSGGSFELAGDRPEAAIVSAAVLGRDLTHEQLDLQGTVARVAEASSTDRILDASTVLAFIASSASDAPSEAEVRAGKFVNRGDSSALVEEVQSRLRGLNIDAPSSGVFDDATVRATKQFQRTANRLADRGDLSLDPLRVDGVLGPATLGAIADVERLSREAPASPPPSWDDVRAGRGALTRGQQGEAVLRLQRALGAQESGTFDQATERAVRELQSTMRSRPEFKNLIASGVADQATLLALDALQAERKDLATRFHTLEDLVGHRRVLKRGAVGQPVRVLQERLQRLGYLSSSPDGSFGQETLAAVMAFQRDNRFQGDRRLEADGVVGQDTVAALQRVEQGGLTLGMVRGGRELNPGDHGSGVEELQTVLKDLGHYRGRVTGVMDAQTTTAVAAFKRAARLKPPDDPRVGKTTVAALDRAASNAAMKVVSTEPAYRGGRMIGEVQLVELGGHKVELRTAKHLSAMFQDARSKGVELRLNSGFRTMSEQQRLFAKWIARTGNEAARPGYSNHQNGSAVDIDTVEPAHYEYLQKNAHRFGFERTVPGEPWHWELLRPIPGMEAPSQGVVVHLPGELGAPQSTPAPPELPEAGPEAGVTSARPVEASFGLPVLSIGVKRGDNGPEVKKLQYWLAQLGFMADSEVDSDYGPKTATALDLLQSSLGDLAATGTVFDKKTKELLDKAMSRVPIAPITAQSSSAGIKRLQGLLIDAGFLQKGQDTGTMGPATSAALKSLQQTHNKAPSGAYDQATSRALFASILRPTLSGPAKLSADQILRIVNPPTQRQRDNIRSWTGEINAAMARYQINTPLRVAHFIAQIAHESDGFNTLEEYASGAAYEGRLDLGNTQPGDGRKFKGRGAIQTTGRGNYGRVGQRLGQDFLTGARPKLLATREWGFVSSGDYWVNGSARGNLNILADQNEFVLITKGVNGGTNGIADRRRYLANALRELGVRV